MLALPACLSLVIALLGLICHLLSSAIHTAWWKGFITSWRKMATLDHIHFSMLNGRSCRKQDWKQVKLHSSSMQSWCGPSLERFDCGYYLLHRSLQIWCLCYVCYEVRTLYIFIIDVTDRTLYNYILLLTIRIHNWSKEQTFQNLEVSCMKKILFFILRCYYIHCDLDIKENPITRREQLMVLANPGLYLGCCLLNWV